MRFSPRRKKQDSAVLTHAGRVFIPPDKSLSRGSGELAQEPGEIIYLFCGLLAWEDLPTTLTSTNHRSYQNVAGVA